MFQLTLLTECTVKLHLALIKTKAVDLVTELKVFVAYFVAIQIQCIYIYPYIMQAKAKNMHVEMEEWIGLCYKKEVERYVSSPHLVYVSSLYSFS